MTLPPETSPTQPGQGLPDPQPALTGHTVPSGWGRPPKPRAPGTVVAAAVLTYIRGGLGVLAALFLIVGSSVLSELGLVWAAIGIVGLAVSALYVAAAVMLQVRANRTFLLWLVVIDLVFEAFGLILTVSDVATYGVREGGGNNLCSIVLPIIVLILLRHRNTTEWIEARRGWLGPPTR